jgi:hypothetical protein
LTPSNEISAEEIFKAKQFSNFLNAAKDYCNFIETEGSLPESEFLRMTQAHLLTVYSLARQLPSVNLQVNKDFEGHIDDEQMKALLRFISERVPFSYYWSVPNPVDMKNLAECGTGDLIDDLGDIYKDLKCALLVFEVDDIAAKENAIWQFKFDFEYHWGEHCIEALSAIHHYLTERR